MRTPGPNVVRGNLARAAHHPEGNGGGLFPTLAALAGGTTGAANSATRGVRHAIPLFSQEGPRFYESAYTHNEPFAKPGPYRTSLSPTQEHRFRSWVNANNIPFDPAAQTADYDMRGFWLNQQHPGADGRAANGHFPDTYKTPYDTSFSNESQYALPATPFRWKGDSLVDGRNGQIVFGNPPLQLPRLPKLGPLVASLLGP